MRHLTQLVRWILQCRHSNLGWPICFPNTGQPPYRQCLDCGAAVTIKAFRPVGGGQPLDRSSTRALVRPRHPEHGFYRPSRQ
jgi:hypothetical protein